MPALQDNRIQGGTIVDPFLSAGLKAGTIRSTGDLLGTIAPRIIQTAYAVRRDYLVQNRAALIRFARVIRTANEYMNTHRSEFATLTEAYTGIPVAAQTPDATLFATATEVRDFQPWYDMAFKYGTLPSRVRADEVVSPIL
jgi:ABC-type nitrate/sulfonate/bicarbonate transport system substrate-binding protein